MKRCPTCSSFYVDEVQVCARDAAELVAVGEVMVPIDPIPALPSVASSRPFSPRIFGLGAMRTWPPPAPGRSARA